jgi:hypothetical protein
MTRARHTFTAEQRQELLVRLGVYPEQVRRLETHVLQSIWWRQVRPPRMQDVRERLADLAKALRRVETLYVRMSVSKIAASQEANARLQSAADDLLADADKLGESLETATNIVNRALEYFSPTRRSTRKDSAYFVRLILKALQLGHAEHFDCTGYGDTPPSRDPMRPFLICVGRKRKPFAEIARIVSEATGEWSSDDAIKSYLKAHGGKSAPKKSHIPPTTRQPHAGISRRRR